MEATQASTASEAQDRGIKSTTPPPGAAEDTETGEGQDARKSAIANEPVTSHPSWRKGQKIDAAARHHQRQSEEPKAQENAPKEDALRKEDRPSTAEAQQPIRPENGRKPQAHKPAGGGDFRFIALAHPRRRSCSPSRTARPPSPRSSPVGPRASRSDARSLDRSSPRRRRRSTSPLYTERVHPEGNWDLPGETESPKAVKPLPEKLPPHISGATSRREPVTGRGEGARKLVDYAELDRELDDDAPPPCEDRHPLLHRPQAPPALRRDHPPPPSSKTYNPTLPIAPASASNGGANWDLPPSSPSHPSHHRRSSPDAAPGPRHRGVDSSPRVKSYRGGDGRFDGVGTPRSPRGFGSHSCDEGFRPRGGEARRGQGSADGGEREDECWARPLPPSPETTFSDHKGHERRPSGRSHDDRGFDYEDRGSEKEKDRESGGRRGSLRDRMEVSLRDRIHTPRSSCGEDRHKVSSLPRERSRSLIDRMRPSSHIHNHDHPPPPTGGRPKRRPLPDQQSALDHQTAGPGWSTHLPPAPPASNRDEPIEVLSDDEERRRSTVRREKRRGAEEEEGEELERMKKRRRDREAADAKAEREWDEDKAWEIPVEETGGFRVRSEGGERAEVEQEDRRFKIHPNRNVLVPFASTEEEKKELKIRGAAAHTPAAGVGVVGGGGGDEAMERTVLCDAGKLSDAKGFWDAKMVFAIFGGYGNMVGFWLHGAGKFSVTYETRAQAIEAVQESANRKFGPSRLHCVLGPSTVEMPTPVVQKLQDGAPKASPPGAHNCDKDDASLGYVGHRASATPSRKRLASSRDDLDNGGRNVRQRTTEAREAVKTPTAPRAFRGDRDGRGPPPSTRESTAKQSRHHEAREEHWWARDLPPHLDRPGRTSGDVDWRHNDDR